MLRSIRPISLTLIVLLASTLPTPAAAQFRGLAPTGETSVRFEVSKPFFGREAFIGSDFGLLTSGVRADVVVPAGAANLWLGLGLVHATADRRPSSTTLSNLAAGVVFGDADGSFGSLSVILPTSREFGDSNLATRTGFAMDLEEQGPFLPDIVTFNATYTPRKRIASGGAVGGRAGASLYVPDDGDGDAELFGQYALFAEADLGSGSLGAELSGATLLSDSVLTFSQRTVNYIVLYATFAEGRSSPQVFLRLPVDDDARGSLDAVVGVRVTL